MLYEEKHEGASASEAETNDARPPEHDGIGSVSQDVDAKESKALGVRITNGTAQWTPQSHEKTLNKVTLDIKPGMLVAVIGPVGAGKVRAVQTMHRVSTAFIVSQRVKF
jgi:ABC-type multidrug transport system fused ATPase/permease subunit